MHSISASCFSGAGLLAALAFASDGVRPRPSSADYPASTPTRTAIIGATLAPADQVKKVLPAEISKKYVVVEVAFYPQPGSSVDVLTLDFALKFGPDEISYASTPRDLALLWREKQPSSFPGHGVDVTTETGVTYSSGNDPVNGRTRGWSTYEGVAVTNGGPSNAPPPPPHYDPNLVEARARDKALPEGVTSEAVAGYLYFPLPAKKHKGGSLELKYAKDGDAVSLTLPVK